MGVRARQLLVAAVGLAIAVVMLWLGLWQMRVFEDKEASSADARAAQPAVPLLDHVAPDGNVGDVYGRQVTVTGRFLAGQEVPVVDASGQTRVLTAFEVPDGRVLPVVRGVLDASQGTPPPPSGTVEVTGVFLPSEAGAAHQVDAPAIGSVRLPVLAQVWRQQLLPGFVTLAPELARDQGLEPAAAVLPSGSGSWQNYGYALQWWVFAAFAVFMTIRFVRAIGRDGTVEGHERSGGHAGPAEH